MLTWLIETASDETCEFWTGNSWNADAKSAVRFQSRDEAESYITEQVVSGARPMAWIGSL